MSDASDNLGECLADGMVNAVTIAGLQIIAERVDGRPMLAYAFDARSRGHDLADVAHVASVLNAYVAWCRASEGS